jgi:hypothetical protein
MIFKFAVPISSAGVASVTNGIGSVSSRMIDSSNTRQYVVNLTGVTNAQSITVTLSNVIDVAGNLGSTISTTMGVLIGDTTANGMVNSSDVAQTQSQSGQPLTADNFREDVNVSGAINSSDIALVQSQSGTALSSPAPSAAPATTSPGDRNRSRGSSEKPRP